MLKGHLLNERYRINETIGGGGMANVYLARDIILNRDVAIKVLRLDYANDEEFIARFDREAQSATSLAHPNIINIYDVGEEDQILYMVMEYVDGMTLKEYIQRYGPVDVHEALDIMKQITAAISHAHANDIVHRDIKPQNILMDTYGQAKVTDFGIAVALSATSLTQTNSILGSVHYLSPEQARGGMATKKSDIYSLGIVLFELLTGRLPFSGQSPVSIALKHLQNDTPSVKRFNPNVPQSVENIVLRATAKDPFHRYETVYDMEEALEMALDPSRMDEEKYTPPNEAGEETKAIPIITDNQLQNNSNGDTIVHQTNGSTIPYSNEENKDQTKNGKRKKNKKWLIFFIVLFTLLASGIAALFVVPKFLQPEDVEIPDVSSMEYEQAMAELQNLNLKTNRELEYSDDIEDGIVIKTDPEAGNTVKEEDTVTLIVSQGKEKVEFDDYIGDDFDQTKRILEDKGFDDVTGEEVFSDRPVGEILSQQPSSGSEVIPAETAVTFEISKGPEPIAVRNLQGMTEQEAISNLEEQELSANIIEENSEDVPKGEVIRQDPVPYTELEDGDEVDVYISTGPEEKPPVHVTRTFTVPYDPPEQQSENPDEPVQQSVKIYIEDANRSISDVAINDTITKDKEYEITLTINPGSVAEYQVIRDDKVFINNKKVPYEEGE
ncbi:Stk1 family PASTA domain-containing Ser/Thr kinase [Virgibacillus doumboii]|uniref:Stk1 family PASTA domain-containing Ser/Thr kinase n=1 Tax=Virgibacillus doumboii TaxID=2697503 RepID=UPI0013E0BA4A|nr:Stk1 family PASTA domain-containing Ser/Thr kinase [Virgibacillus doumboii]